MRSKGEIVGAVDFGSRDVRVLIVRKEEDGTIHLLGHGKAQGRGCISQGVIQDLGATQVALKHAIADAERESRVHVNALFCGINGRNVETFIREGNVKLEREVVDTASMEEALEIASHDVLGAGKRVLSSSSAQEWYVDGLRVENPIGIRGQVLKARVHFARIPAVIEDNIVQCIESQRRELEDIVFLPLASALGCLTPEDMELGVGVLDLGRSTTGLAVFRDRQIMGSHCFEWGGYHLTRDVAAGLHISFEESDELIHEYGISDASIASELEEAHGDEAQPNPAEKPSPQIKLKTMVHGAPSIVPREQLDMIILERAREMLIKTRQFLHARGLEKHLIRGVVLTGGTAALKNYIQLAESVFETPCRIGLPDSIEQIPHSIQLPEFTGVVGIAHHGLRYRSSALGRRSNPRGPVAAGAKMLGKTFRKYFF